MFVVGRRPDNGDEAFVDQVPVMDDEVHILMEEQRSRRREIEDLGQNDQWTTDPLGGGGTGSGDESTAPGGAAPGTPVSQAGRRLRHKTSTPATPGRPRSRSRSANLERRRSARSQPVAGASQPVATPSPPVMAPSQLVAAPSQPVAARSQSVADGPSGASVGTAGLSHPTKPPQALAPPGTSPGGSLDDLLESQLFGSQRYVDDAEHAAEAPPSRDLDAFIEDETAWMAEDGSAFDAPPTPSDPCGPPSQRALAGVVGDAAMSSEGAGGRSEGAGLSGPGQAHDGLDAGQQGASQEALGSGGGAHDVHVPGFDPSLDVFFQRGSDLASDMTSDIVEEPCDIVAQTDRYLELVERRCPAGYPLAVKRVAVGALCVYRYRLIDMSTREHTHLLYIVEGWHQMRAHRGTCYVYRNGAFTPFTGVPPQGLLGRVKEYVLRLEGLFRTLDADTDRSDEALLVAFRKSVDKHGGPELCLARWEGVSIAHSGPPRRPRGRGGGEDAEGGGDADEAFKAPPANRHLLYHSSCT